MVEIAPDQVGPDKPKPPSRKAVAKRKPSKKPSSPVKATGPAQTPEQELAASLGKFVHTTAATSVAAAQKVAENFLEELLGYVHGDKKK